MSRKDPRCSLIVPVSAKQRDLLRVLARGGSLGDALRRVVQAELVLGITDHTKMPINGGGLPLQLPRATRRVVETLAQSWGQSPQYVIAQALAVYQSRGD